MLQDNQEDTEDEIKSPQVNLVQPIVEKSVEESPAYIATPLQDKILVNTDY